MSEQTQQSSNTKRSWLSIMRNRAARRHVRSVTKRLSRRHSSSSSKARRRHKPETPRRPFIKYCDGDRTIDEFREAILSSRSSRD